MESKKKKEYIEAESRMVVSRVGVVGKTDVSQKEQSCNYVGRISLRGLLRT